MRYQDFMGFSVLPLVCILYSGAVPSAVSQQAELGCGKAIAEGTVCAAANDRALQWMQEHRIKGVIVVQNVETGALVMFAASHPYELDVTTPVFPLSFSKVLLAAAWWDSALPDLTFTSSNGKPDSPNPAFKSRVTIHEMLVGGSDSAGREAAIALRNAIGTSRTLELFARYGFVQNLSAEAQPVSFWGELSPVWAKRLNPVPARITVLQSTSDNDWAETLSLGESNITVTALHTSRDA